MAAEHKAGNILGRRWHRFAEDGGPRPPALLPPPPPPVPHGQPSGSDERLSGWLGASPPKNGLLRWDGRFGGKSKVRGDEEDRSEPLRKSQRLSPEIGAAPTRPPALVVLRNGSQRSLSKRFARYEGSPLSLLADGDRDRGLNEICVVIERSLKDLMVKKEEGGSISFEFDPEMHVVTIPSTKQQGGTVKSPAKRPALSGRRHRQVGGREPPRPRRAATGSVGFVFVRSSSSRSPPPPSGPLRGGVFDRPELAAFRFDERASDEEETKEERKVVAAGSPAPREARPREKSPRPRYTLRLTDREPPAEEARQSDRRRNDSDDRSRESRDRREADRSYRSRDNRETDRGSRSRDNRESDRDRWSRDNRESDRERWSRDNRESDRERWGRDNRESDRERWGRDNRESDRERWGRDNRESDRERWGRDNRETDRGNRSQDGWNRPRRSEWNPHGRFEEQRIPDSRQFESFDRWREDRPTYHYEPRPARPTWRQSLPAPSSNQRRQEEFHWNRYTNFLRRDDATKPALPTKKKSRGADDGPWLHDKFFELNDSPPPKPEKT